jgi:hypothetical protein
VAGERRDGGSEVIEASLTMLECTRCHSGIRSDQMPQIIQAFRALTGEQSRVDDRPKAAR